MSLSRELSFVLEEAYTWAPCKLATYSRWAVKNVTHEIEITRTFGYQKKFKKKLLSQTDNGKDNSPSLRNERRRLRNAGKTRSTFPSNEKDFKMQPTKQDEVCLSLIQRELAVLNNKVTKVMNVNQFLLNYQEKRKGQFILSPPTARALLLILFAHTIRTTVGGPWQENNPTWMSLPFLMNRFSPISLSLSCCFQTLPSS